MPTACYFCAMKSAMIFAAGLGTRLRPFTDTMPKALVPVAGVPLIEVVMRRLRSAGVGRFVINVHHFADQIEQFVQANDGFGAEVVFSDERGLLLDTGGGLKQAAHLLRDGAPFFVCNADILTNLDLDEMYRAHLDNHAFATLAVMQRDTSRRLLFDGGMQLCGWQNTQTGATRMARDLNFSELTPYSFSGVHVISPLWLDTAPPDRVFSMIDWYLATAANHRIVGYPHPDAWVLDVGKPDALEKAAALVPELLA